MLNLSGNILVFVKEVESTNEKGVAYVKNVYSTTVGKKLEDGSYMNMSIGVSFSNNLKEAYNLNEYADGAMLDVEVLEAWPTCWGYDTNEGEKRRYIQFFINDARIEEHSVEEAPAKVSGKNSKASAKVSGTTSKAIKRPLKR